MKRISVSFVVFVFTLIMITGTGVSLEAGKKIEKNSLEPVTKLIGPLKHAAKIYRTRGKLETKAATLKGSTRLSRIHGKTGERRSFLSRVLVDENVQARWKQPGVDVLKCLIKVKGNLNQLKTAPCPIKIRSVSDTGTTKIVSVELRGPDLEKVAALSSVVSITPVPRRVPSSDKAVELTGASVLRTESGGEFQGITGKGVIIGINDNGIDVDHEDFKSPDGKSRILYLWDPYINTPGKTPADLFGGTLAGMNFGTVWTAEDIDNGLCTSTDINGHGTHVAGLAAGNGRAAGQYAGMAPEAGLIVVKNDFTYDGLLFIYEMASRLEKPCVAYMTHNMFLNLHQVALYPELYPADGTGAAAQMINGWNQTYGPGFIPVMSAGNYGHWNSYTNTTDFPYKEGTCHSGSRLCRASTHVLDVPSYADIWASQGWQLSADDFAKVHVGMWYERPVRVSFISPGGKVIGPMVHGASGTVTGDDPNDGAVIFKMDNPEAANGHFHATFELTDHTGTRYAPLPGKWEIRVEPIQPGPGRVDLWCADLDWWMGDWYPIFPWDGTIYVNFENGTHSHYILDESASPYVITVGAYVSKLEWMGIDGAMKAFPRGFVEGSILYRSAPGPARNLMIKPDIAAPGSAIVASLCKEGWPWADPNFAYEITGKHAVMSGTSSSTPAVAGGIALILEKFPNKSIGEIRTILRFWAKRDCFTRQYGPNAFGFGKFNIKPLKYFSWLSEKN